MTAWPRSSGRVHRRSRCPVVFLPHVGKWCGKPSGDLAVGEALRERIGDGPELILSPLLPAARARLAHSTSNGCRQHALPPAGIWAGGRGALSAIYQDQYTSVKLTGALGHAELAGSRVPIDSLLTDLPGDVFDELWSRRQELTEHLASVTATWPSMQHAHWDEVWRAITESEPGMASERTAFDPPSDTVRAEAPPAGGGQHHRRRTAVHDRHVGVRLARRAHRMERAAKLTRGRSRGPYGRPRGCRGSAGSRLHEHWSPGGAARRPRCAQGFGGSGQHPATRRDPPR